LTAGKVIVMFEAFQIQHLTFAFILYVVHVRTSIHSHYIIWQQYFLFCACLLKEAPDVISSLSSIKWDVDILKLVYYIPDVKESP
jgi:hypothetical protein